MGRGIESLHRRHVPQRPLIPGGFAAFVFSGGQPTSLAARGCDRNAPALLVTYDRAMGNRPGATVV